MAPTRFRTAYILSALIVFLTIVASAGGLWLDNLYQDNDLVTASWKGNDLVTLLIAMPVMVAGLAFSLRGSCRARLVWLGMLDYTLYNFAFYLFGAAFNGFFLIYVAVFTLSIFALVFLLARLDIQALTGQIQARPPARWISGFMLVVALGLTGVYVSQSLGFITTGQLPEIVLITGHPTSVVFALDLSLVVSVMVLAAVWLWQRQPWGYVLAAIANIKGMVYMLALSAATVAPYLLGISEDPSQIAIWIPIAVGNLLAALTLLHNARRAAASSAPTVKSAHIQPT